MVGNVLDMMGAVDTFESGKVAEYIAQNVSEVTCDVAIWMKFQKVKTGVQRCQGRV